MWRIFLRSYSSSLAGKSCYRSQISQILGCMDCIKINSESKFLHSVLLVLSIGFLVLYLSHLARDTPPVLTTTRGKVDISFYFLTLVPNAIYGPLFVLLFLGAHYYIRIKLPRSDPFILPMVAILSGIGLIVILRLSPDLAFTRNEAIQSLLSRNPDIHVKDNVLTLARLGMKHFIFIAMGLTIMVASISFFNQRIFAWLSSKKHLWIFASALLITVTLILGTKINERRLWLFGVQTIELVKLLIVLFIAGYLYEKGKGIRASAQKGFKGWLSYAGPFIAMCFFALIPLFIQRDLGPTFLILIVFLLMFHYGGNSSLITFLFVVIIMFGGFISYTVGFPSLVRDRFDMVFDPFGRSEAITRTLWSISSGGLFGSGVGYGQSYRIPEVQSDFTFSAICEEMGFIGGITIILAYAILIYRCFQITSRVENTYNRLLVVCITTLFGIQAFIIIFGNLGIIPMTGITLPFVSYGGSSLIMSFLMVGIVIRVSGDR